MPLNLAGLETPITLRTAKPLSDEELMRFSEESKPYKIERTREGEVTIMTPVGYTGGQHEIYVASELLRWAELDGRGSAVGQTSASIFPMVPASHPTERGRRIHVLKR